MFFPVFTRVYFRFNGLPYDIIPRQLFKFAIFLNNKNFLEYIEINVVKWNFF